MPSLPPHTSHRIQALDVTFFGPFEASYKRECNLFSKSGHAEKITHYDVPALSNKAYEAVAFINKGVSEFRSTDGDPAVFIPTLVPKIPLVVLSTPPMDPAVSILTLAFASLRDLNTVQVYTLALPFDTPPGQVVAQTSPSLIANFSSFLASATPVTQTIPQFLAPPIASTSSILLSPILAQRNIVSYHTAFKRLLPIPEQTACVKPRKGGI
ncbi:hypothetical protein WA026_020328 [Henosepilachna vigintioctopunctata]|uniref:Uncharacterized protein n=1 Tax=Henosepilachna vigintioctopunctata TaxID=420089 RepID=A0AAW1TX63_9CUCU